MGFVYDTQASAPTQRLHSVSTAECEHPLTPQIVPQAAEFCPSTTTAGTPLAPLVALKYYNSPAKRFFIDLLERDLGIVFQGFQPGYAGKNRTTPDLLLFMGPHGSTLAVPLDSIFNDRETALEIIQAKKIAAEKSFEVSEAETERDAEASRETVAWG
jgi:hypothetical protein